MFRASVLRSVWRVFLQQFEVPKEDTPVHLVGRDSVSVLAQRQYGVLPRFMKQPESHPIRGRANRVKYKKPLEPTAECRFGWRVGAGNYWRDRFRFILIVHCREAVDFPKEDSIFIRGFGDDQVVVELNTKGARSVKRVQIRSCKLTNQHNLNVSPHWKSEGNWFSSFVPCLMQHREASVDVRYSLVSPTGLVRLFSLVAIVGVLPG